MLVSVIDSNGWLLDLDLNLRLSLSLFKADLNAEALNLILKPNLKTSLLKAKFELFYRWQLTFTSLGVVVSMVKTR